MATMVGTQDFQCLWATAGALQCMVMVTILFTEGMVLRTIRITRIMAWATIHTAQVMVDSQDMAMVATQDLEVILLIQVTLVMVDIHLEEMVAIGTATNQTLFLLATAAQEVGEIT